ncbi:MAG: hypothetical protein ACOC3V_00905 [bacterium]
MKKLLFILFKTKKYIRARNIIQTQQKRKQIETLINEKLETVSSLENLLASPNVRFSPYYYADGNLFGTIKKLQKEICELEKQIK